MRLRQSGSLALLGMFVTSAVAHADSISIARIVSEFAVEHRFQGSVLVAEGDRILYEGGFGEADRTWHIPNRPDTVFLVGSVSKQFTSMLILQLVQEGKLGLEDPLSKHLPEYPADKADITLHQLLSHASGLPHYGGFEEIDVDLGDYLRLDRSVASYVDLIGRLELQSEPGTEYSYSSMGYVVLAYIAEQVTGKSYGRLIEERIAGPLEVSDLGFAYNHEPVERLAHGYEYNLRVDEDGVIDLRYEVEEYRDQSNKYSTGGVHASVRALFRWARGVISDDLLSPELRERMFTAQIESYGYGWRIEPGGEYDLPEEVEVISHGGSLSGYRASILILDRGRYTVIALGNSSTSRSSAVTQEVAKFLHGEEPGAANILGTAVAWTMVRDGVEAARALFRREQAADFANYFNNDFAFYAYADEFADLGRSDLGLALAELGLEAHPESAMLRLGVATSHHQSGNMPAASAAAQEVLRLIEAGADVPGWVESEAREILDALKAAA